jgi:hypothetical protein
MEVGVCEYNATTREFHRCQYREAELKVLQKVRDRKKYLRGLPGPHVAGLLPRPTHVRTRSRLARSKPAKK